MNIQTPIYGRRSYFSRRIVTLLIMSFSLCCEFAIGRPEISLIPMPNDMSISKGSLLIFDQLSIVGIGMSDEEENFLFSQVRSYTGMSVTPRGSEASVKVELMDRPGEKGAYVLDIDPRGIRIKASSLEGLLYGVSTLNQILYQSKENKGYNLPHLSIKDRPAYEYRGFMLDASRHFQSVDKVKNILDFMSALKLNVFHWHLTDNEGWRIESKKFPKLNQTGSYISKIGRKAGPNDDELNGFYTVEEISEVLQYAKQRHIEVIPEVDVPGHNWALLTAYPQYRCPGHPTSNSICGSNQAGIEFVKEILEEVVGIFNPKYIHIGGDERKKGIWETCPLDQAYMTAHEIENEDDLQNLYLEDITAYVHSLGVTTIAWAENIEGGIPSGQITQSWHRGESQMALDRGHRVIVSDHYACYLDYPATAEAKKLKPEWMPVLSLEKVYNFDFTPDGLTDQRQKLVWGGESPLWTEHVLESEIYDQIEARIEAHAERSWTAKENKDLSRFERSYDALHPYLTRIIGGKAFEVTQTNPE